MKPKEFFREWKKGIRQITPYQQSRIIFQNTWLMLFGILIGFVFTLFNFSNFWWLSIILFSAFINTIVVQIGNYQKYKTLKDMHDNFFQIKKNKEVANEQERIS